jgi:hypothetical protein
LLQSPSALQTTLSQLPGSLDPLRLPISLATPKFCSSKSKSKKRRENVVRFDLAYERETSPTKNGTPWSALIQLAEVGRTRWKIENENNNTLKTKGYHLEHNFGHGQQDLANVLTTLNMLAFLLHTVQEIMEPAYQCLRHALGARKTFFDDLRALTRYILFESWDDLFAFMEDGLERVMNF